MSDAGDTQTQTAATPLAMNRREFAEAVGISVRTAMRWSHQGIGPKSRRLSSGRVRYVVSDVREWLSSLPDSKAQPSKAFAGASKSQGVPS